MKKKRTRQISLTPFFTQVFMLDEVNITPVLFLYDHRRSSGSAESGKILKT